METHEAPYMVQGNTLPLEPGMAFSILLTLPLTICPTASRDGS